MRIILEPQRRDEDPGLTLSVAGDVLTVMGEEFDFSPLAEGEILPSEAIASPFVVGPVIREGGDVIVRVLLPHGGFPPDETLYPAEITTPPDGGVAVPPFDRLGAATWA